MIRKKRVSNPSFAEQLAKVPEVETLIAFRDRSASVAVKTIPTGCPGIDVAIGRGGWPLRRLSVLWGMEGAGKTTLALHSITEAQRRGARTLYMDVEYKMEPPYASALGVDMDRVILCYPLHVEACFALMKEAIRLVGGEEMLIVVDSISSLPPKGELEAIAEGDPIKPGSQALAFSVEMRNFIAALGKSNAAVVFISQTRVKFGSKFDQITSGNAIRFYASLMVKLRHLGSEDRQRSTEIEAAITKNSIAVPFRRADYTIRYGKGIDQRESLVKAGLESGVIELSGGWYVYKGEKWHGLEKFAGTLEKNPEFERDLRADIYGRMP